MRPLRTRLTVPMPQADENEGWSWPGVRVLLVCIAMVMADGVLMGFGVAEGGWNSAGSVTLPTISIVLLIAAALAFAGLTPVVPGEARVVQLFGKYHGTIRASGLQ